MARKINNTYPVITITVGGEVSKYTPYQMSRAEAMVAQDEIKELIATVLRRTTKRQLDVDCTLVEEAICEHCRYCWTEKSPDYNGGCCSKDEANSPERLADLRKLAEEVSDGTFYPFDDERAGRVAVNWPDALGTAIVVWVDAGRPESEVAALLSLAKRVRGRDWCTVWTDPGPSGCSLARLPDEVHPDARPEEIANELCSLIDDMGLLPARQAVA